MSDDPELENLRVTNMPRNVPGERRERSHDGRTLKASICDLIDNSIDGGAYNIQIQYEATIWRDAERGVLLIEDDVIKRWYFEKKSTDPLLNTKVSSMLKKFLIK